MVISMVVAFLGPMTNTMYLPALPVVARDLDTTEEMVDLTIAVTYILLGCCPMIWGSLSDQYGRRIPMLTGTFIHMITSLGLSFLDLIILTCFSACAFAWNIESLLGFRVLQAIGCASLLVIGAGSISDIYPPAIRGNALGWFTMAPSVGPLIGPPIGGKLSPFPHLTIHHHLFNPF